MGGGKEKVVLILLLITITFIGKAIHVELFFGSLVFNFGGVGLYAILEVLGFIYALPVALLLSFDFFVIHKSPVSGGFLLLELLGVSVIKARSKYNLVLSDWLFWFFLGLPAYFLLLKHGLGYEGIVSITTMSTINLQQGVESCFVQ